MRKLCSFQVGGTNVREVLDHFNERAGELGISDESDIVSVCAMPATRSFEIQDSVGGTKHAILEVVIVYWSAT
jgi:hypothetical protein